MTEFNGYNDEVSKAIWLGELPMTASDEAIHEARMALQCLYLVCEASIADDVKLRVEAAIQSLLDEIEGMKVAVLYMSMDGTTLTPNEWNAADDRTKEWYSIPLIAARLEDK